MSETHDGPACDRQRVHELMDKVAKAMSHTAWFEAERLALRALHMARQVGDFAAMASIVLPLQEARRQRYQLALDCGEVVLWTEPITEETTVKPGCYLVEPPQVGADARRLRIAALLRDVPAAVICREPVTRLGLWPVVAISGSFSVRTCIDPPADPDRPDLAWFAAAMDALGEEAIAGIDPEKEIIRCIDAVLDRLDAVPEHETLHQFLCEKCREAQRLMAAPPEKPKSPERKQSRSGRSRVKS